MNGYEATRFEWMAGASAFEAVVGLLLGLAVYILYGVAFYRMADKLGIPNGWMGFVPIANVYLLGKIADADEIAPKHAKRLLIAEIIALALSVVVIATAFAAMEHEAATAALMFFAFVLIVVALVNTVFTYIAYYRICENFAPQNTKGYFLGILLGGMCCSDLIPPILLLVLSGNEPDSMMRVTYTEVPPPDNVFQ